MSDTEAIELALAHLVRGAVSLRLHERIVTETGVALERGGYGVLGRISDRGPCRLSELAQMIGLDPSTVSRHVRQLERQGLAVRDADPTDARAVSLEATAAGRDAIQRVRGARRALLERVLADWPAGDRRELARLLTRLTEDLTTVWRDA